MPQLPKSQRRNCYTGITMPLNLNEIAPSEMVSRAGLGPGSASLALQVTDSAFTSITPNTSISQTPLHSRYTVGVR